MSEELILEYLSILEKRISATENMIKKTADTLIKHMELDATKSEMIFEALDSISFD